MRKNISLLLVLLTFSIYGVGPMAAQSHAASTSLQDSVIAATQVNAAAVFNFEVATVKAAAPSPDGHTHVNYPPGGAFSAINITLSTLMQWAYDVPENQILGRPPWMSSTRFDLQAKADGETDRKLRDLPSTQANEKKRAMVQALLADRFDLKLHQEVRVLAAYDLTVAKGGSKLVVSNWSGKDSSVTRTSFKAHGLTPALIAQQLAKVLGSNVVDKTGLLDRYDLSLEWTPDDAATGDSSAPPLLTAIQEQLGLKLIHAKEALPVLVIDQIQQPSAN